MPTRRLRGPIKTGAGKLTQDQLDYLTDGFCLDGAPDERWQISGRLMPFPSWAALEKAWEDNRAEVRAQVEKQKSWSKELRSWSWWTFDSPEPKRQLSGPKPVKGCGLYRGLPGAWESYEDSKAAIFETDFEYLKRLDLLLPGDIEWEK